MIRPIFIACLLTVALFYSCKSETKNTASEKSKVTAPMKDGASASESTKPIKAPDDIVQEGEEATIFTTDVRNKEYKQLLQGGHWISQSNFDHRIAFDGDSYKTFKQEELVNTTTFSVDATCEASECMRDGKGPAFGWCFTVDGECYLVTILSQKSLKCKKLDEENFTTYKRLQR